MRAVMRLPYSNSVVEDFHDMQLATENDIAAAILALAVGVTRSAADIAQVIEDGGS